MREKTGGQCPGRDWGDEGPSSSPLSQYGQGRISAEPHRDDVPDSIRGAKLSGGPSLRMGVNHGAALSLLVYRVFAEGGALFPQ